MTLTRPERREVGRALDATRAGRLADGLTSLRRLVDYDARQRWVGRRERDLARSQLTIPSITVSGREDGGRTPSPPQRFFVGRHGVRVTEAAV